MRDATCSRMDGDRGHWGMIGFGRPSGRMNPRECHKGGRAKLTTKAMLKCHIKKYHVHARSVPELKSSTCNKRLWTEGHERLESTCGCGGQDRDALPLGRKGDRQARSTLTSVIHERVRTFMVWTSRHCLSISSRPNEYGNVYRSINSRKPDMSTPM